MKTILVLHTGGTISMSKVAGGSVAPNEKNPLMEQEALFSGKVHLVVEDIFNIPSTHDLRTDVSIKRTDSKSLF